MTIGTTIKKLRRDRDITQEKLAEYLNISPQAISRWETDLAMPDISFLPLLANIFNVTTDYLLGVDITKRQEKIGEYGNQANALNEKGDVDGVITIWRKALYEFPNDYGIMIGLASALMRILDKSRKDLYCDEALVLSEKAYTESTDGNIRNLAVLNLVNIYTYKGEYEKAKQIAESMPNLYLSSNSLLSNVLEGEELLTHERFTLDQHFDLLIGNIQTISGNMIYTPEEKLELLLLCEKLYTLIYGNDIDEIEKRNIIYSPIAKKYALVKDADKTLEYMGKAMKCAITADNSPDDYMYPMTSLLAKGTSRKMTFSKNYNYNQSMLILKAITELDCYDFIRDNQRFKDIVAELEQYAKYE